ncbi:hypothetical protein TNCV_4215481 [Trichonephila clavipes]|nr:hypothetical protein TNCV_4215481 [Trichonephila clavipes]
MVHHHTGPPTCKITSMDISLTDGLDLDYNMPLSSWPSRSSDLTFCEFFLLGYVKEEAFIHPLAVDLVKLTQNYHDRY